ncbi:MAG: hypothetical protein H6819_08275 [Phycisphaerales bacterium]|nr:hypothetical protein [Phycisphaerales bacterium]MCB9854199.1 hypothetical protein [Phycisphaerales bacterium]MCB9864276.1 hypothetical protein [Phycisphaerales bacterium]
MLLVLENESLIIDLGKATNSPWFQHDSVDTDNDGRKDGIYDATEWAVVFQYTSIEIQAGATVTFINHPKGAPVVWLSQTDAIIAGTVSVDGMDGTADTNRAPGGPGGFSGGVRRSSSPAASAGEGPGGGQPGCDPGGGGFGTAGFDNGTDFGKPYGSPRLLPLIGGSGGGGLTCSGGVGGGGGGGAILIAANDTITIAATGLITANGGDGWDTGVGSGGGIRLVADVVDGNGALSAICGNAAFNAGDGRIRVETLSGSPPTLLASNPPPSPGTPGPVFLEAPPKIRIKRIQSVFPPLDPFGSFVRSEDALIASVTSAAIVELEAENVDSPLSVPATLIIVPAFGTPMKATSSAWTIPDPVMNPNIRTATVPMVMIPEGRSVLVAKLSMEMP